ncbi:MAG: hypothetical protein GXY83_09565 [Rhodopirellula sp.]|nr:hypothetical protein [Rhodopirellula sp.]
MIRVTCPNCQSKLNAKDELIGQSRNCPKCQTPVLIARPVSQWQSEYGQSIPLDDTPTTASVEVREIEMLPEAESDLERLDRQSRYVVVDSSSVLATWENNGQGWLLKTREGYLPASRNADKLPTQGHFSLVELRLGTTDEGFQLRGVLCYRLAERWALLALARGDDPIVKKVQGPGSLSKGQKFALCEHIKEQFMREVWASVPEIHDYLLNTDYHSPGVDVSADAGRSDKSGQG